MTFEKSSVLNVQGPIPRGQMAQFDKVTGENSSVRCNIMENRAGESTPEDGINMYLSTGTLASPIVIVGNRIRGGGPSTSGGVILLGDGGGASAYQVFTVDGNQVDWTNKDGSKNPWWDGGNCAALSESKDDFSATPGDTIIDRIPDACR